MEIKPFEKKIWLASPTMHGEELKYMQEAYETNWMSTVGANINEVERISCEKIGCGYAVALSSGTAALHLAIKLAGERLYGQPKANHGALVIPDFYACACDLRFTRRKEDGNFNVR